MVCDPSSDVDGMFERTLRHAKANLFPYFTHPFIQRRIGGFQRFVLAVHVANAVLVLQNDSRLILHRVRLRVQLVDEFLLAFKRVFLSILDLVRDLVRVRSPSKKFRKIKKIQGSKFDVHLTCPRASRDLPAWRFSMRAPSPWKSFSPASD